MPGSIELPRYQCFKEVHALKIKEVFQSDVEALIDGGLWEIVPEDPAYASIRVPHSFISKHRPSAGGYYVVYGDGYTSFSPAEAFETGYVRAALETPNIPSLLRFYDVENLISLVNEQDDHVRQLQARLKPFLKEPHQIGRLREG